MPCETFRFPGGGTAIVCSRGRQVRKKCVGCGKPATLLCDYPLQGKRAGKTCDRPICAKCATKVPGVETSEHDPFNLCPQHKDKASEVFFQPPEGARAIMPEMVHSRRCLTPPEQVELVVTRKPPTTPAGDDAA